jgi:hypothetical protein
MVIQTTCSNLFNLPNAMDPIISLRVIRFSQFTHDLSHQFYFGFQDALDEMITVGLEEEFSTVFVGRPSYFSLGSARGYRESGAL